MTHTQTRWDTRTRTQKTIHLCDEIALMERIFSFKTSFLFTRRRHCLWSRQDVSHGVSFETNAAEFRLLEGRPYLSKFETISNQFLAALAWYLPAIIIAVCHVFVKHFSHRKIVRLSKGFRKLFGTKSYYSRRSAIASIVALFFFPMHARYGETDHS